MSGVERLGEFTQKPVERMGRDDDASSQTKRRKLTRLHACIGVRSRNAENGGRFLDGDRPRSRWRRLALLNGGAASARSRAGRRGDQNDVAHERERLSCDVTDHVTGLDVTSSSDRRLGGTGRRQWRAARRGWQADSPVGRLRKLPITATRHSPLSVTRLVSGRGLSRAANRHFGDN